MSLVEEEKEPLDQGGQWEQLDTSRREIVTQLCGEKGQTLFTFLITSSTIHPDQDHIAVVSQCRLRDIATQLGWSHDTVKRYVAVFRALGLVHHYHDHRREITLQIPLGPYTPLTNFAALDDLLTTRKKQSQLAARVKARYILRFGDPTQVHSDAIHKGLEEIKTILDQEHLEPLKRQRLQMQIANLLARLIASGVSGQTMGDPNTLLVASQEKGDLNDIQGASCHLNVAYPQATSRVQGTSQGDPEPQQGDLSAHSSQAAVHQSPQQGDSNHSKGDSILVSTTQGTTHPTVHARSQGDLNQQQGDPKAVEPAIQSLAPNQEGDPNQQQGDLKAIEPALQPVETSPLGDPNPSSVLEEGDSDRQGAKGVQPDDLLTYNVNYLITNLHGENVKRKRFAQFLAARLDQNTNMFPAYLKLFKEFEPGVIGRAFLATMVLMHYKHWAIAKPGAFFTTQCRALTGQAEMKGYTLDEVEEWLRLWGDLAYRDFLPALSAQPDTKSVQPAPASLLTPSRQGGSPVSAQASKKGLPGHFGMAPSSNTKKRTYGMHYTGRLSGSKAFNNFGSFTPPPSH